MRRLYKLILLVSVFTLVVVGCSIFDGMSEEEFRQMHYSYLGELVVEGIGFEVVDFNFDTDSVVFTYETAVVDEVAFWVEIDGFFEREEELWKVLDGKGNVRRYKRIMPPREGSVGFYSAEQIRIAYDPGTANVIVAWVQSDTSRPVDSFEESNQVEVGFAEERIWPIVDEFVREHVIVDVND
jgi:hypothetical protein